MTESWLPVVGHEDLYEVSDQGRVRSLPRLITRPRGSYQRGAKILAPWSGDRDRQLVNLCRNGSRVTRSVHVLVAQAFLGPCPDGMEVCHRDDDSTNNKLSNLRYDTHSGNSQDQVRNGNHHQARKVVCPQGHSLMEPFNLRPAGVRDGKRQCLSCAQARTTIWKRGEGDLHDLSDRNFQRLALLARKS